MTNDQFLGEAAPKPFAGCIAMLDEMIADGTLDRFNVVADARGEARNLVLVVFNDGSFCIQTGIDAEVLAVGDPDYVTAIPLVQIEDAIRATKLKGLN